MILKFWIALALLGLGLILVIVKRETIKRKLQERYERTSVKIPNIKWTNRKGETFTEDIIVKRSRFPIIGDWGRIYPVLNEDGSWNWINSIFGGKKNFVKVLLVLGVIGLFLLGFYEVFKSFEIYRESCVPMVGVIK